MYIGRGITLTDQLTRQSGVRIVDHAHWHLVDGLVVVYPRIEQRIQDRHHDEEHKDSLVLHHLSQLLEPDVAGGLYATVDITEYRHK